MYSDQSKKMNVAKAYMHMQRANELMAAFGQPKDTTLMKAIEKYTPETLRKSDVLTRVAIFLMASGFADSAFLFSGTLSWRKSHRTHFSSRFDN